MKISTKSTKEDLVKAYKELQKQYSALEAQVAAGGGGSIGGGGDDDDGEVVDIFSIIRGLGGLRGRFGDAARTLQQKLTTEATSLGELRSGIDANIRHLSELHGITAGEGTFVELLTSYRDTQKAAEEGYGARKKELDAAAEAAKIAWKKEQEEHHKAEKEAKEELDKSQRREAAEYEYVTKQRRQADADAGAQAKKGAEAELVVLREARGKAWAEREKAIAEREAEYAGLKAKKDAHPGALESASKRAEEEGRSIARQQAKITADLLAKENEGKRRVYELKIASLEGTIKKQAAQVDNLSKQLATALKQAQDLAVKAIEGASNATSFNAIREIAMEQAKTSAKGK
ncbi:MAG: hypothetical protein R3B09_11735 [Nannocystaceae bacterium]